MNSFKSRSLHAAVLAGLGALGSAGVAQAVDVSGARNTTSTEKDEPVISDEYRREFNRSKYLPADCNRRGNR